MSIVKINTELLGEISYEDTQYKIGKDGYLRYISKSNKPIQPIGLTKYNYMFSNIKKENLDEPLLIFSDWDMINCESTDCMLENTFYITCRGVGEMFSEVPDKITHIYSMEEHLDIDDLI